MYLSLLKACEDPVIVPKRHEKTGLMTDLRILLHPIAVVQAISGLVNKFLKWEGVKKNPTYYEHVRTGGNHGP